MSFDRRNLGSGFVYNAEGLVRQPQNYVPEQRRTNGRRSVKEQRENGAVGPRVLQKPLPTRPDRPTEMSFFSGIPAKRNELPIFNDGCCGVPPMLENPVGYYHMYNRLASDGSPMTLWYYYSQGDGPHKDKRYGDKLGGPNDLSFWVKRPTHEGSKLTDKAARADAHVTPPVEGTRLRGMSLGFPWLTSLRAPRGSYRSSRPGSNYGSRNHSGFNTPGGAQGFNAPRRFDPPGQAVWDAVNSGIGMNSGFNSGFSSVNNTRPTSPNMQMYSGHSSAMQSGYNSENEGEWSVKVSKGKKKAKQQAAPVREKPLYQKLLSGGVERSIFYESESVHTTNDQAWEKSALIAPSNHYIRHAMHMEIRKDDQGKHHVLLVVPLPQSEELLKHAVELMSMAGNDINDHVSCPVTPEMQAWYDGSKCETKSVSWGDTVEEAQKPKETADVVVEKAEASTSNIETANPFAALSDPTPAEASQPKPQRKTILKKTEKTESGGSSEVITKAPSLKAFTSSTPAVASKSVKLSEVSKEQKL